MRVALVSLGETYQGMKIRLRSCNLLLSTQGDYVILNLLPVVDAHGQPQTRAMHREYTANHEKMNQVYRA